MIVGARKVNGFHGLLQFWSFRSITRLPSGLGKTRNLLVKCVKRVSWSYFEIQKCQQMYMPG